MTGVPIGWWGFNKRKNSSGDMTYCTIREITQGMFQTPNMHTVLLKYGKKYYNISAIKTGLFIFMEGWFKAPRILKKCKFFLKIYYSKSND